MSGFERLQDVCFDPGVLERDLDLARFTGREWLIGQIDDFIATRSRGYVVVQGEAGVGKTSLAAHLTWTRPWLYHFTLLPGGRSPEAARKSLAAQAITRWNLVEWAPGGVLPGAASRPDWFDRVLRAAAKSRDEREPAEPIVLVVDGLDEADKDPDASMMMPLGLPPSLPDGVFVLATTRFGIDQALHAIRHPADWLQIEVEGEDNLNDMRRFIYDITSAPEGDGELIKVLGAAAVDVDQFQRMLAERCAGVWIYLRYVLDEVRGGLQDPRMVGELPGDLAGYYATQIGRWRGDSTSRSDRSRWNRICLPLLGVLGVARAPLTARELARFSGLRSEEDARAFLDETARAFLSRNSETVGLTHYSLRHQSLRDFLSGTSPAKRRDLDGISEALARQSLVAHRSIASALIPPRHPHERDWSSSSPYATEHLAIHAAACGLLDGLVNDPGFLSVAAPQSVLAARPSLRSMEGRTALAAFELSMDGWASSANTEGLNRLEVNASKVGAGFLAAMCAQMTGTFLPVRWVAWFGQAHRILTGHDRGVNAVAVGRAGNRDLIVSASRDSTVRVWDASTGKLVGSPLTGHTYNVHAVALGRAGTRDVIVSGGSRGELRLWDAISGELIGNPPVGHRTEVSAVAMGRVGGRDVIVSGDGNGTLRSWDAASGAPIGEPLTGHQSTVSAVALGRMANREVIVSSSYDSTVRIWDAATGESIGSPLAEHGNKGVSGVAIATLADRDVIVSTSWSFKDFPPRIWDATTRELVGSPLRGHSHGVCAVAIGTLARQDVIVTGSWDKTVRIWDAVTGEPIGGPLTGHTDQVTAVAINTVGGREVIVSGSEDGTVRVWDADAVGTTATAGHDGRVEAVAIGRMNGRDVVISGSWDKTARIWDAASGEQIGDPIEADDRAYAVAVGRVADRDVIVIGSGKNTVRILDASTREPIGRPMICRDDVETLAVGTVVGRDVIVTGSDDGSSIGTDGMGPGKGEGTVLVWDAVTGHRIGPPLGGHSGWARGVAIGWLDGRHVIVGGFRDGSVQMWDAASGELIHKLTGKNAGRVVGVAIGQLGGQDVIVSAYRRAVLVWDVATPKLIGSPLYIDDVSSVAIGRIADRDVIVSGTYDGTMQVWDGRTREQFCPPLIGHAGYVSTIAVGNIANRDVIVSGSDDGTIILREYRSRNPRGVD